MLGSRSRAERRQAGTRDQARLTAAGRTGARGVAADNALKILLLLGERSELRLTDVAEYLQVATSTAHRLLAMLQYRGFMRQDPRHGYDARPAVRPGGGRP